MKIIRTCILAIAVFALEIGSLYSQTSNPDTTSIATDTEIQHPRFYPLTLGYQPDIRISGNNGMALQRFTEDIYMNHLAPHISGTAGKVIGTTWNVFFSYFYTLWPHEFGHWMRTQEIGVQFTFHDFNPLLPYTTVDIPAGRTLTSEESALVSIAGFEVNSYIAQNSELNFYKNGYGYSSELMHAWINKMFFPVYAFLVFPIDPESTSIWKNTMGDPVHVTLPVYERFTGRPAVKANGKVDADLVSLYRTSTWLSLAVPFTDPFFYQALISDFSRASYQNLKQAEPWILLGDKDLGWTYGTHFNPSPLGYEVYFTNYLFVSTKVIAVSLKSGGPFLNQSIGIQLPDIIGGPGFNISPHAEIWRQSFAGIGGCAGAEIGYQFGNNGPKLWADLGYKTSGYSLGLPLEKGLHAIFGLTLYFIPEHVETRQM